MNDESKTISPVNRRQIALICAGLAIVTMVLFWPLTHSGFTNVDDERFITENAHVQAGLTWAGAVWAFHSVYTEAWQPLTWFSHMLDCQLYGLNAGGHHLTSVLIHIANTLLLFLWLLCISRAPWRSAMVAALFAWHPLHVESVAWICERKDVLSTFFWLLALHAYTRYVKRPGIAGMALVILLYIAGLMSKPMVVTLPCVMLLLDFWPFNRFGLPRGTIIEGGVTKPPQTFDLRAVFKKAALLVAEKLPFFALGLVASKIAVYAQIAGGSLGSSGVYPLATRISNALASYLSYLEKTFWPTGLAFFYPYEFHIPLITVLTAVVLLSILTICAVLQMRQKPYFLVGWLWFVGTLVPTIGLVQFCVQARADRYTYMPSMGLFLMLVWGMAAFLERRAETKKWRPVAGAAALAGCLAFSSVQISYWQNALTVARHALAVTENNYVADESVGRSLVAIHHPELATNFFAEAVRIEPGWPQGQFNFGITLAGLHETNGALEHLKTAADLVPQVTDVRARYAAALLEFGKYDEAVHELTGVLHQDPNAVNVQMNLGLALAAMHREAEAVPYLTEAVRQQPDNEELRFSLGCALLNLKQPDKAAEQFVAELKVNPNSSRAHFWLGRSFEQRGKLPEAVAQYRQTLAGSPGNPDAQAALDKILSEHPDLK